MTGGVEFGRGYDAMIPRRLVEVLGKLYILYFIWKIGVRSGALSNLGQYRPY